MQVFLDVVEVFGSFCFLWPLTAVDFVLLKILWFVLRWLSFWFSVKIAMRSFGLVVWGNISILVVDATHAHTYSSAHSAWTSISSLGVGEHEINFLILLVLFLGHHKRWRNKDKSALSLLFVC
jgi:hypothetical protein